jgi:hypothetical protein
MDVSAQKMLVQIRKIISHVKKDVSGLFRCKVSVARSTTSTTCTHHCKHQH